MTIIGIAGGTGSGKSTFTDRLKKEFGDKITVIYYDNYYKNQDHLSMEERKLTNYDHPDALDTELLITQLEMLKNGEEVCAPKYDFSKHTRSQETITLKPAEVVLVEGILVLSDERLFDMLDMKVYVEADADERILRRVRRDVIDRGRDLDGIIEQYLTTVKPMHYLYVAPTRKKADIVINSGMNNVAFELFKTKIENLLK